MSIENEILRLQNAKAALKSSINAKGGTIADGLIDTYAAQVDTIQTSTPEVWQPNPAWPNLKTIIDNDTENYIGKVAILYTDDVDVFDFDLSVMQAQAVKTSDGQMYTANATHTWDKLQDISGTRWVIWYYSDEMSEDIIFNSQLALGLAKWIVIGSNGMQFNWRYKGNFYNFSSLESIENYELGTWDTSQLTNMVNQFGGCYSLQTIPQLDTSQVTSMSSMFSSCYSLKTIPLLDTSNVISMNNMFQFCFSLQTIPLLDTSNVTNMQYMFDRCYPLQTIPQLDTSKVTSVSRMFYQCYSLKTIPLLDTSNVTDMSSMLYQCYSLQTIPLLDTSNVTNMNSMLYQCYSLQTIPLLDTSKVTDMSNMFNYCSSLQTIPQLDTSKVTDMSNMFDSCFSLTKVNIDTSSCVSFDDLFDNCYVLWSVGEINLSGATDTNSIDIDTFDIGSNQFRPLEITFTPNTINIGITISRPELTHDSLISLINGLVDRSATTSENLVIGATNIAKLSQAELDQITAKNWTYS